MSARGDQCLRLSAPHRLYKSLELYFQRADLAGNGANCCPIAGPEFDGAAFRVDAIAAGGLPKITAQCAAIVAALRGRGFEDQSVHDCCVGPADLGTHHKPAVAARAWRQRRRRRRLADLEGEDSARLIGRNARAAPGARPAANWLRPAGSRPQTLRSEPYQLRPSYTGLRGNRFNNGERGAGYLRLRTG